jgi:hypothetical protein
VREQDLAEHDAGVLAARRPDRQQDLEVPLCIGREQAGVLNLVERAGDFGNAQDSEIFGLGEQVPGGRLMLGVRYCGETRGSVPPPGVGGVPVQLGGYLGVACPASLPYAPIQTAAACFAR